ncbi:peptidylprolyl isomerase [Aquabacterium sp. J223]|uniref:peptidylprolyl isomerase n=1 Tax=Aquabacterium sp. J223 TaxID=2898431 RepID=UPI0021ADD175|nr:peptidylprolyl isomerase [Aquabacterium sp. J223]UUX97248.1 peptidylprolyl isomerase [Aquabacterium sp. J223]
MNPTSLGLRAAVCAAAIALLAPVAVQAQNIAVVNGKSVPKARVDALMKQAAQAGQPIPPEMESRARDVVVMQEIFAQEAERRGLAATPEYKQQMELARTRVLIDQLRSDFMKNNQPSEADMKAEYDKVKAEAGGGTEYKARHILVEKEEDAKALIAQLKSGAKFEDLAKKSSKDPGSAQNGGDLDWASPGNYVAEFSSAMTKLKKGEVTEQPVKSQFGWHVIRLDDTREQSFPAFEEVKPQLQQRLTQVRLQKFQEDLRAKARTDYKFSSQ